MRRPTDRPTKKDPTPFPTRGTPSGWRDPWDDPDLATERLQRLAVAYRLWLRSRVEAARGDMIANAVD